MDNDAVDDAPQAQVPQFDLRPWMLVIPLCCPRMVVADGRFMATPYDRRMRFLGDAGNGNWTCIQCMRELRLEQLPPIQQCPDHPMALVIDGDVRYYSCCSLYHEDVPMPLAHNINVDESFEEIDAPEDDVPPMGTMLAEEATAMRAILNTYDTADEEIALEAILADYNVRIDVYSP